MLQGFGGIGYYLICAIAGLVMLGMAANEWLRLGSSDYGRMALAGGIIILGRLAGAAALLLGASERVIACQEWALESITLAVIVWAFLLSPLFITRWTFRVLAAVAVIIGGVFILCLVPGERASDLPGLWLVPLLLSVSALVLWFRHRRRFSWWLASAFLVSLLPASAGLLGATQIAMLGHLAMLVLIVLESYGAVVSGVAGLGRRFFASSRQAQQQTQEMAFLLAVSRTLSDSLELRVVLERISEAVARAVDADWAYFLMPISDADEQLVVAARYGWWGRRWTQDSHPSRRVVIYAGELSLIRHALLRRRSVLANAPDDYEQFECLHDRFARPQSGPALIQPIIRQDRVLGVLLLGRVDLSPKQSGLAHRQFTDADAQLCQDLMIHIATAIQNARLYESVVERSEQAAELSRQQESESLRLHAILDAIPEGVVVVTETGNVAFANAAAERILNVPRQHLLGRIISPLYDELLRDDRCEPSDRALFEWDGKLLMSSLAPVRRPDGKFLGDVVVFRDVTGEQRTGRAKADYHAALSRDLEDLLAFVRADTHLLVENAAEGATPPQNRLLDTIGANIEQMTALLSNFEVVSALEREALQIDAQQVDMGSIIGEAAQAMQTEAEANNLEFAISVPSGLNPAQGDPQHLRQIMLNLLDHVVRHAPPGGKIDLWATEVSLEHQGGLPRDFLVVSIRDPGTFIPPEELSHVFELAHQVDGGRAIGSASARVGLAVCKGLVAAHGGHMSVTSVPDEGSTFSFSIPTAEAD